MNNLNDKFYIERCENDSLFYIYKKDHSLFECDDVERALKFFENYIIEKVKMCEFYGYTSFDDLEVKSSLIKNRYLSVKASLKENKIILRRI